MLFVQQIDLVYTKKTCGSSFANVRRSLKFLPVEFDKADITDEILFDDVSLSQAPEGICKQHRKTKPLGENALFVGKFSNFFGYRVFIKRAENGYEILYIDKVRRGRIKSKFTLTDCKSGRITYNERCSGYFDSSEWYYHLFTFNFVCTDKANFKSKIFFIKEPDFVFNDMKSLRYSGF